MIGGIVLAAGRSERFGSRKLVEPLNGLPLVCHSVRCCLSATEHTWIVIEQDDIRLREVIDSHFPGDRRLSLVVNPDVARGQMSSLKIGLAALSDSVEGAMIVLADMPFVTSSITAAITGMFERTGNLIVPVCDAEWRHPRIVPRRYLPEFLDLGDDEKGTSVFQRHSDSLTFVFVGSARDYADIDRRSDLDRATDSDWVMHGD